MDVALAMSLGVIQLLLALMGVIVSVRPPKLEYHRYWISGFIIIGLVGVALTGWLSLRASREQSAIHQEMNSIVKSATGANLAATKANNSVLEYQRELSVSRQEELKAKKEMKNLINRTSAQAERDIKNLGKETQASLKAISTVRPPRRIPERDRAKIIAFLSRNKYEATISAIANDPEAWRFAQDWYEVLLASGWTIENRSISTLIRAGGPYEGLVMRFHGSPVPPGKSVRLPVETPEGMVGIVAQDLRFRVTVQRSPQIKENEVQIEIYSNQ